MNDSLNIRWVEWRNFMSYGAQFQRLSFEDPGTALVIGSNLDASEDGGVSSNGTGKTTAMMAVVFALYGKHLNSKINLDDLVNDINKKNLEVKCEFSIGENVYFVHRTRKTKAGAAGNTVKLFQNGKDITPDRVDTCNELIAKIIGMPFEIFTRIVIFSATHTPFLDLPTRHASQVDQTGIIEHLCGITILSDKAEELKKLISDTDLSIKTEKSRIEVIAAEQSKYQATLTNAKNRSDQWEQTRLNDIVSIESALAEVNSIDLDEQQALLLEQSELSSAIDIMRKQSNDLNKSINSIAKNIQILEREIDHLENDRCHACLQLYDGAKEAANDKRELSESLGVSLIEQSDALNVLLSDIDVLEAKLGVISPKIVVSDVKSLYEIKSRESELLSQIDTLKQSTNPHLPTIDELNSITTEEANYDKINTLTDLHVHQTFLHRMLTRNDSFIRKRLLDRNIPFLNGRLKLHLQNLGMPFKVEFTHNMQVVISRFGRSIAHENLSSGQRARINFALAWAFRDVYQRRYRSINVSMLDEVLDAALDTNGVKAAVRLLKAQARDEKITMLVISHRGDDLVNYFDRVINVIFEKGFSRLECSASKNRQDDVSDLITA